MSSEIDVGIVTFPVEIKGKGVIGAMMLREDRNKKNDLQFPWHTYGFDVTDSNCLEIMPSEFKKLAERACENGYLNDTDFLEHTFYERNGFENVIDSPTFHDGLNEGLADLFKYEEFFMKGEELLWADSLGKELERIKENTLTHFVGHPVHYAIYAEANCVHKQITEILLSALYDSCRLTSRRYCVLKLSETDYFRADELRCVFEYCKGGTLAIQFDYEQVKKLQGSFEQKAGLIDYLCSLIREYRNEVLTVFCFPEYATMEEELFSSCFTAMPIVRLKRGAVGSERAQLYFLSQAKEDGIDITDDVAALEERTYNGNALKRQYQEWYSKYLREKLYPQYADIK